MRNTAITSVLMMLASAVPAHADYYRIGPGPGLDYAMAYCDNAAMMEAPQHGVFAMGSAAFVGGAMLGTGLGNLIRRDRYKSNCMVMQGWKWGTPPGKKTATKVNWNSKSK